MHRHPRTHALSPLLVWTTEAPLSERQVQCACFQVLEGLRFLHCNGIIHRDIKAANLMLTDAGRVKLGDFGVSAMLRNRNQRRSSFIGSPNWMAPEVALCETDHKQSYDYKVPTCSAVCIPFSCS